MKCELEYCVYNEELKCLLESPLINGYGMCDECVLVRVPNIIINNYKSKLRSELEKECH